MKTVMTRALAVLVCFAALFSSVIPALAAGTEIGTTVSIIAESFEITSQTEDFTLGVGEDQQLMVAVSQPDAVQSYLWEVSTDGGVTWTTAPGTANAATYDITNAQENKDADGKDVAYQYRVTVTSESGATDSAIIKVLVSDDYAYRKISLRDGDTDVSAYMHDLTRLVVTPLDDSAAATELEAKLAPGCLPLMLYDVKLVNQDDQVVPYFGALEVDFHVGDVYEGMTLRVFHLHKGTIIEYSGMVTGGVLSIIVNELSPFMVEVPADDTHTVEVTSGANGSVSPSGTVNVADGADKTFTFLPDAGYEVDTVTVDGATVTVPGNSYTFSDMQGDHTLNVTFRQVASSATLHTVTITSGANGTVSPIGTIQVQQASAQTFYFYPDEGYELDEVLVNGVAVSVIGNSYTISAVDGNTTVAVSFRQATTQLPDVYKTITASAGAGGSISPSGSVSVEYGGGMYFYFIPNTGYEVDEVKIDGTVQTVSGNSYRFINVIDAHTIHVTFKRSVTPPPPPPPTYHIITASSGTGGSISPTGSVQVAEGGSQTFTFIPATDYEIDTVTVDGAAVSVSGSSYTFSNVTAAHTIRVTFKRSVTPPPPPPTYYTISASSGTGGSISPTGSVQVAEGDSQTFYFIPDAGYEINSVTVDGTAVTVSGSSYTFNNVTAAHTIRVTFKRSVTPPPPPPPPTYYTITASSGTGGSISPTGSVQVAEGDSQTFYFIPDAGYEVNTVTVDGTAVTVSGSSYRFTNVTAGHTIRVTFKQIIPPPEPAVYHTIKASSGAGGSISPDGNVQISEGSDAYFYFIPDAGYEVDEVTIDRAIVDVTGGSYCFEDVDADHTIHVSFKEIPTIPEPVTYHTITVIVDGGGSISPSGDVQVADGGAQTFYLIADEGYEVEAIYVNGEKQDVVGSQFTVENVTSDTELRVSFKQIGDTTPVKGPHCFICRWLGRDIAPWCWLIPLLIVIALVCIVWYSRRRRRETE